MTSPADSDTIRHHMVYPEELSIMISPPTEEAGEGAVGATENGARKSIESLSRRTALNARDWFQ